MAQLARGLAWIGGLAGMPALGAGGAGLYRSHFERGVAELSAGEDASAAQSFRHAGELAPDAPLWRAYLARAEGRTPAAQPELTPSELGPWTLVPRLSSEATFDPTGERLISGYDPACIWDARTGERIAVVSHREAGAGWRWQFDTTGRALVGLGRTTGDALAAAGVDVRAASSGEPLLDEVLAIGDLKGNTRFTWMPAGTRVDARERRSAFQVALTEGVLRWSTPPTRVNEQRALSPDGRRAAYVFGGPSGVLRLVDTADASTIARIDDAGWRAFFSSTGRFLAAIAESKILLLDAETGERLEDAPAPQLPEGRRWVCCFSRDELVLVDGRGQVVFWDPAAGEELRRIDLTPPPVENIYVVESAAGGSRLILNGTRLRAFDSETGRQVWTDDRGRYDLSGAVSADGRWLATGDESGGTSVRDSLTGSILTELESLPLGLFGAELLDGGHALVSRASDGTLRRIELASGKTTAFVEGDSFLRSLDAERLLSWEHGTRICLRDPATLRARASIELEPAETVQAIAPSGERFLTLHPNLGLRCRDFSWNQAPIGIAVQPPNLRHAVFSPDSARLALVFEGRVRMVDAAGGETICEFALRAAPAPRMCRFYGEDKLAIGWGNQDAAGVDVIGLPGGERSARLGAPPCLLGGTISDLRCDPDVERIVFSVSSCGYIAAHGGPDWSLCWSIDYGGGNPSQLSLRRAPGSNRLCVSGMSSTYARVVDIVTGEVLAQEQVDGCCELAGTAGDGFIVGSTRSGLAVLSGETFEPLYVRSEGALGSAWIVRKGKELEVDGAQGWNTSSWHLERGGLSYPADCWDAWLLDPLGLARKPLDVLPEPPRIVSGPPRVVLAAEEQVQFALEIVSGDPLLGVQVEIEGRSSELALHEDAPAGARAASSIMVAGPWPADLRLRAVARSGVSSAPWRVRVEPFR